MNDRPEATDALFDISPRALAARFGELALRRMHDGRDCAHAAWLAFSYAVMALEEDEDRGRIRPFRRIGDDV